MGAVGIQRVGRGFVDYQYLGGPTIVTQEFPSRPYGLYLFNYGKMESTGGGTSNDNLVDVTGMGLTWTRVPGFAGATGALDLLTYRSMLWVAVGAPRAGPFVIEARRTDGSLVTPQTYAYALYRLFNVPLSNNGLDAVLQHVQQSMDSEGNFVSIQLPSPVGQPGNLIVGVTTGHVEPTYPDWPFVQDWNVYDTVNNPPAGEGGADGAWTFNYAHGLRTSRWKSLGTGFVGVFLTEFGYRRKPWLRQRQRDDF